MMGHGRKRGQSRGVVGHREHGNTEARDMKAQWHQDVGDTGKRPWKPVAQGIQGPGAWRHKEQWYEDTRDSNGRIWDTGAGGQG